MPNLTKRCTRPAFGRTLALVFALGLATLPVGAAEDPPVAVPAATAEVSLDGQLGEQEWAAAARLPMSPSGEAWFQAGDGELYVALRAGGGAIASVCVARGDRVAVLHASAALGTATYERGEAGAWERRLDFEWCCRGDDAGELEGHLRSEGWVGSTFRRGAVGEMELRIDPAHERFAGEGPLRLAPVALDVDNDTLLRIPERLADGCAALGLVQGVADTTLSFDPETWLTVELPGDGDERPGR